MKLNILSLFVVALALTACEKTVMLDVSQGQPHVIIEGQVTNISGYQYVKVTRSSGFYETGASPRIENAAVTVTDDAGNHYDFVHNPGGKADSAGYYLPTIPFVGVVGRNYHLEVLVDEQVYEANDLLNPVTKIDSLTSQINEEERDDPDKAGKFYEVLMFAKEPQNTTDYYLFKFYRNDSLTVYSDTDIYYADDELLGENIDGVPSPVYYAPGDLARVEMYSISRDAFVFYNDLQRLLTNDGGLFGQPPSNSRSNLSNGALGFFQASSVDVSEVVVKQ
ncbi:DUF4249 family protein [Chryseolinea sp. T2]|uniref:DUF4249 family protein n=1 Tax=Chryseolinea sp. T2 TaxID=3129255 RepID=UPI00307812B2